MGEYAKVKGTGERVKIGTCEDMYYLRADQRHQVWAQPGNVNPVADVDSIRFRFPFPDEDHYAPGEFGNHDQSVTVWGATLPDGWEHGNVQFSARNGYLVSLPCPEGPSEHGFKIHRNGYGGAVKIVQQRAWDSYWVTVVQCGGCGHAFRLETFEMAQEIICEPLEAEAEIAETQYQPRPAHAAYLREIVRRVRAGYVTKVTS